MAGFKLQRAADWSQELHAAADTYEHAINTAASNTNIRRAEKRYREAMLEQDRRRRPEFYAATQNQPKPKEGEPMLRWVQTIEGFDGFCERCLVAEVGDMDGIFYWSLNISRRRNESNSGVEKSIEAAKAAAETAFRAWLDRAGLMPKLPIYELPASFVALEGAINEPPGIYDTEPVEVRSYRHSIYPKWQQVIRDTRAMLAAAPKPGEAP